MKEETLQQKLADRLYELLPHKKGCNYATCLCWDKEEHELNSKDDQLRLADLLLALGKLNVSGVYVDRYGGFEARGQYQNIPNYNLSQDNILNQSDKFCEWVLELLK